MWQMTPSAAVHRPTGSVSVLQPKNQLLELETASPVIGKGRRKWLWYDEYSVDQMLFNNGSRGSESVRIRRLKTL